MHNIQELRRSGEQEGEEGVCSHTEVRYQLLKAGQTNSVGTLIEGIDWAGGQAADGDSLVGVGDDGGTDGCDSPQLSRPSIQRRSSNAVFNPAANSWIAHVLRMTLIYQ